MAFRFATDGDLRFISHHDTMRMFQRALSRARLPVKYSEGFNPIPKLSIPLPRPVGLGSDADLLVVELTEAFDPHVAKDSLARQMPEGIHLQDAWRIDERSKPKPLRVTYELALPESEARTIGPHVEAIREAEHRFIQRPGAPGKPSRKLDVKAHLLDIAVHDGLLRWIVAGTNEATVRPVDLLRELQLPADEWHHRVRRVDVQWQGAEPVANEQPSLTDAPDEPRPTGNG